MNPTLVAGLVLLAIVATVIAQNWWNSRPKSGAKGIIVDMENKVVDRGWKALGQSIALLADSSAKKAAVDNATADLAEHFDNVRKLKAAVSQLPEA